MRGLQQPPPGLALCAEKESVRREIREFLSRLAARHPGVPQSIAAALGNVNPYTLFDPALRKDGGTPDTKASQHLVSTGEG